ncbi:MAG: hypothetical protein U0232_16395 [Thermomicrobiales bacterium]
MTLYLAISARSNWWGWRNGAELYRRAADRLRARPWYSSPTLSRSYPLVR